MPNVLPITPRQRILADLLGDHLYAKCKIGKTFRPV